MKKILTIAILIAVGMAGMAQRNRVSVGWNGAMKVNGETVAYIEREGCKLLNNSCQFFITDESDNLIITVTQRSLKDRETITPSNPDGTTVTYLVFAFKGSESVAEVASPFTPKEKDIAKTIALWRLIKDKQLDPEAVTQFIAANGTYYSDKERRQHHPPHKPVAPMEKKVEKQ